MILRAVRVLLLLAPAVIALEVSAAFAESGNVAGLVDIGSGRKMYLECSGTGSPTVVLISGKGNGAADWSEILDPADPASYARLKAYEKAGYLLIDPRRVRYLQPDFREPDEIDLTGGARPLSLSLIVRRVGRESEPTISGAEVLRIVKAIYRVYGETFRRCDMAPVLASLEQYPATDELIDLLPPTSDLPRQ